MPRSKRSFGAIRRLPGDGRVGRHRPYTAGSDRSSAASARQSPPNASVIDRSETILLRVMGRERLTPPRQAQRQAGHHRRPSEQHPARVTHDPGPSHVKAGWRYPAVRFTFEVLPSPECLRLRQSHSPKPEALSLFRPPSQTPPSQSPRLVPSPWCCPELSGPGDPAKDRPSSPLHLSLVGGCCGGLGAAGAGPSSARSSPMRE